MTNPHLSSPDLRPAPLDGGRQLLSAGLLGLLLCLAHTWVLASPAQVRLWQTNLVIPTYLAAPPSPVPRFYEGRTYQGAKATFYPYPVQDVLTDIKTNKSYKALFLENDYLQICVIPELGGRIWSAMDKANGYDFFYRQHVVKPALIGMLGAWISGGVEWNVPHHHRASSFMPVDFTATPNNDGSATIWVGEIELRHRMKWLVGMTLYPDRSYLELTCKVFNRTPFAWPMLFWINPAVHANTNYQVLFPPGTEWTVQHGKPEFASWPIARQNYGGSDYTRGVDISWWKNHDTPKSFFAWNYEDDWFGGYDHGRQAGVIHWADHRVAPGKKFFEWGNGPEGEMWTKILTDDDGPYLELMAGAWSDNQPDYSWIQPGETREWKHWWYPIRDLGGVKAATRDVAVNMVVSNGVAKIAVNATKVLTNVELAVMYGFTDIYRPVTNIGPLQPYVTEVALRGIRSPDEVGLAVEQRFPYPEGPAPGEKTLLLAYWPHRSENTATPKPVEKPRPPKDYASTDELYFTGQRIEQLYSPSFEAAPYYEEILRRDPGDYRANTAMGILLCKQWRWDEAASRLSNAVARATTNYIRPQDGEAFYYLGVALRQQSRRFEPSAGLWRERNDKLDAARSMLLKAAWSRDWRGPAFLELAEIALRRNDLSQALVDVDQSLAAAVRNPKALTLKATILRNLGRPAQAAQAAAEVLATDPLDARAALEQALARWQLDDLSWRKNLESLRRIMGENGETLAENTFDLANAHEWFEVSEILRDHVLSRSVGNANLSATEYYLLAVALEHCNASDEARKWFEAAASAPVISCFPLRFEEESLLRRATEVNPRDANAAYLLGCLLYDNQPENAIRAWEESRKRDDKFALTHRNLALAYAQHEKNVPKAIASLEKAVELDPSEPRFFYELDVQYEAGGTPVAKRLEMLTKHHDTVAKRDDALTREIVLLTVAGQADRALGLLRGRHFRNWEGSSQIHSVYVDACLAHGQQLAAEKKPREALAAYEAALEYPENLEVGRARRSPRPTQIQYLVGTAHEALSDKAAAKAAFEKAASGRRGGGSESDYFRVLAQQKLGRADEAKPIFERLVKAGEEQLTASEAADYFAKFGERQSERVRKANAHYLIGLGHLGLGDKKKAMLSFKRALELHPAHLGAVTQMK